MPLLGCKRNQAEKICNRFDGTLAKLENDSDVELAKLEMNKVDGDASFHIGLTNEVSININLILFVFKKHFSTII